MILRYAKVNPRAKAPTRKHVDDAGADVYNCMEHDNAKILVPIGTIGIIHTGLTFEVPPSCMIWVTNKGRSDYLIGGGVVDENFQGELLVKVINTSGYPLEFSHHEAVAQVIILPVLIPEKMIDAGLDDIHTVSSLRGTDGGIVRQLQSYVDEEDHGYELEDDELDNEYDYDYIADDLAFDANRERKWK